MSGLTHERQRADLDKFVRELQERRFFGKVELDIQGGNLLRYIKHESIKLEEPADEQQSDPQEQAADQQDQEATAKT